VQRVPASQQGPGPAVSPSPFPGSPFPLGATVTDQGTNFAVVADGHPTDNPSDDPVQLCLVDRLGTERRLAMTELTYGIWHTFVPGIGPGQRYGYRVAATDPAKILLDPYARRVDSTDYDLDAAATPGTDTGGTVPLGIVTAPVRSRTAPPDIPWEHTVVYEAHVRGLTKAHPGVPPELRGSYAGLAHPAVIEHLHSLRVTAVELLPVHAHADEPQLAAAGRPNYGGYSTLGYFAPHPGYASRPGAELDEFVAMVDALHEAGIEVLLDVVFNHTCEGGPDRPITLSLRGLSPGTYYLDGPDLTGTGNTLDAGPLPVIRLVTDSLRYWAGELGVDGFRFDLAPVLGRPGGGAFDPASALLTAIEADPLLSRRKIIAEPWDATCEGYALGRFRSTWAEWNDKFRGTVRDFWRGTPGVRDLAYRLSGSEDVFGARRPWASVNFVTAHDGFTLRDLVSYEHKHNEANGQGNRDGTDDNRSANYGMEGDGSAGRPLDPAILAVRTRQARNLAATLLLATGTPMLCAGDELWRTQVGNNNAYCVDSPQVWLDWTALGRGAGGQGGVAGDETTGDREPSGSAGDEDTGDRTARGPRHAGDEAEGTGPAQDMLAFFRRLLQVRADAPALHQGEFFDGRSPASGDGVADLMWFAPSGEPMTDADWFDANRRTLAMWLDGRDVRGHGPHGEPLTDDSWLLVLHADSANSEITLPGAPYGEAYTPVVDTASPTGEPADDSPVSAGVAMTIPGPTVRRLSDHRTSDSP
jgi:glycogen operon protein